MEIIQFLFSFDFFDSKKKKIYFNTCIRKYQIELFIRRVGINLTSILKVIVSLHIWNCELEC